MFKFNTALSLEDLPSPPPGKTGWPWTQQSQPLPERIPDGSQWPRISIVTPSYNQGQFIEETIRSVLLQGYPNLKYIIIDGGSTDQSVEIIKKYGKYLTYWVSEPDKGQSHALNKGIGMTTGDIFTFLNSDDLLAPNVLARVARYFGKNIDTLVLCGGFREIDRDGRTLREKIKIPAITWDDLVLVKTYQPQPGTFWRTQVFSEIGQFREDLHYYFDQEFFIRLLMKYRLETLQGIFAYPRIYQETKSQSNSPDIVKERHNTILEFLPKVKGKLFSKLLTYRFVKLTYVGNHIISMPTNKLKKIFESMNNPILWSSPTFIKKLFLNQTN
ncbi:MAG TPA: glycosyltransferase [Cyanobacteria bacterium UBA12227]|nr:glycosyltransferase [Cyanobacteria bacterium UBA12227]HAX88420.1 glycosyltransferase [Cyanobacteria bacterium UBA11370]HBY80606.1 glycosyltransferase [Cyanobacteria bacterium UBA11148]